MPIPKRQRKKYSNEDILNGVASIKNGKLSYREASQKYGIPIATLSNKIKGKVPLITEKPGL